jgi:hypothetical protein
MTVCTSQDDLVEAPERRTSNTGALQQSEILVPAVTAERTRFGEMAEALSDTVARTPVGRPTYEVDRRRTRTTKPHGTTGPELKRLSGALRFMEQNCRARRGSLWWATTANGTPRSSIAEIWKRITRLQGRHNIPAYSATTFETRGGLHAHIAFIGNRAIEQAMRRSAFGQMIKVNPVSDRTKLAKYLAKERTPQAGYRRGHMLGGRLKGSHRLDGGGDRVRLSRQLARDAIAAGAVEPWQRTNAKRSVGRKPYRPRRLSRRSPRPAGQIPLLPEIERPVSRLRDFGGGVVPPAVAMEIEFRRRRRGLSQRQLGAKIGRSQGQIANALRGHDPLSSWAVNRLREILP